MPANLDQINPEMDQQPSPTEQSAVVGLHNDEVDHEGAMAKADLYKLANYSMKLFKQVHDDDQMEAWVQAKITKAADYIASVYHYLEYEMKFSEYGKHLDSADTLSESQKTVLKARLTEAKMRIKELKKTQAEKAKEKKVMEGPLSGGEHDCPECMGSGKIYKAPMPIPDHIKGKVDKYNIMVNATKAAHKRMDQSEMNVEEETSSTGGEITRTKTGLRHSHNPARFTDEPHAEIASKVKSRSASEKASEKSQDKADEKESKAWGKANPGKQTIMKGGVKTTNEAAKLKGKQTKLDVDHDGDIEADDLADLRAGKKSKKVDEAAKPDFLDMDKDGNKKETMKKAVADKKKGAVKEAAPSAGLSKEKKSATVKKAKAGGDIGKPGKGFDKLAKKAGGGEKGEKIAAAAMWKNIKETTAYLAEKKKKEKVTDENLTVVPNPSGAKDAEEAKKLGAMMPAAPGKKDPIGTSESADLTRMRQLTGRLNQNERASVNESSEVASIRALTQKLLG